MTIAALYHHAVGVAVDLVAGDAVGTAWEEPSVLEGYDIGELAGHLGRGLTTVAGYLAADAPDAGSDTVDAPTYFATALADHDPVDSDFHAAVRARSAAAAADGHAALVESLRAAQRELRAVDLGADRRVGVLAGTAMQLDDYLRTRLVELAIHVDDLSASVGDDTASDALGDEIWDDVASTITSTARLRRGSRAVALGLARAERAPRPNAF